MAENDKKPRLRFKGFTNSWEQRKLGEVANRYDNLRVPITSTERVHGATPYYGANGIQDYVDGFTHDGEFILIAEDGANDLKNYPIQYVNGRIWVNNHAHVLQSTLENSTLFLKYCLGKSNLEPLLVGGGRAKLNSEPLMEMLILSPKQSEQTKLGTLFQQLDNLITLHQRKYEKLKNIKKASLDKMFPQKNSQIPVIRFKNFTNSWEQRKFEDVLNYERPDAYIVSNDKYNDTFSTPVLTANKAFILGYSNETRTYNNPCIIFDDFTLDCKYVDFKFMVKSSAIKILTARTGYNLRFAYERLNSSKIENLGHARHYISVVQPTNTYIPSEEEQNKIACVLQTIDNLITLHQRKYEKLKNIKKAMMEQMFA